MKLRIKASDLDGLADKFEAAGWIINHGRDSRGRRILYIYYLDAKNTYEHLVYSTHSNQEDIEDLAPFQRYLFDHGVDLLSNHAELILKHPQIKIFQKRIDALQTEPDGTISVNSVLKNTKKIQSYLQCGFDYLVTLVKKINQYRETENR